jgi:hypothetical protein
VTSTFRRLTVLIVFSAMPFSFSLDLARAQEPLPVPRPLTLTRIRRLEIETAAARLTITDSGPDRFDFELQDGRPDAPVYSTGHCRQGIRQFSCTLNEQDGWSTSVKVQDLETAVVFDLQIGELTSNFTVQKSSLPSYQLPQGTRAPELSADLLSYRALLRDCAPHLRSVTILDEVLAHCHLDSPELRLLSSLCLILSPHTDRSISSRALERRTRQP